MCKILGMWKDLRGEVDMLLVFQLSGIVLDLFLTSDTGNCNYRKGSIRMVFGAAIGAWFGARAKLPRVACCGWKEKAEFIRRTGRAATAFVGHHPL